MASLVEELVTVLEEEEKIYQTLISYGEKKTDILIRADVPELEKLTCLEQLASDDLVTHSKYSTTRITFLQRSGPSLDVAYNVGVNIAQKTQKLKKTAYKGFKNFPSACFASR